MYAFFIDDLIRIPADKERFYTGGTGETSSSPVLIAGR